MTEAAWPALDAAIAALRTAPSRTGSVISTVYGDAILPRGGALALADLLTLMRRLGIADGVVRTAVSRLAKEGVLHGRRTGRRSAYALTPRGSAEFHAAAVRIYGLTDQPWDGALRLAFPEPGADRTGLDAAGFALLSPGVLVSVAGTPEGSPWLRATGAMADLRHIAARAWPLKRLGSLYEDFIRQFQSLEPEPGVAPLDAMAARTVLIHAWRRIALRDPHLPWPLLPPGWPGWVARDLCVTIYRRLGPASDVWLDAASDGVGRLLPAISVESRFAAMM